MTCSKVIITDILIELMKKVAFFSRCDFLPLFALIDYVLPIILYDIIVENICFFFSNS